MSSDGLSMYAYVNKTVYVTATSIFCGLGIICNLFMLITIAASRTLRTSPKHIVIFTLCLSDLYESVAVQPLFAEFLSVEKWMHDTRYLEIIDYTQWLILTSFRILLLITICAVAIMSMLTENKAFMLLVSISMIVASFLYSLVLILPVSESKDFLRFDTCVYKVSLFPQAAILVVLIVDICIASCCCFRSFGYVTSGADRRFPVDVIIGSVMFLVHTIPYRIVASYFSSCTVGDDCDMFYISRAVTIQLVYARYFLQPLFWILCREIRREIARILCRRQNENPAREIELDAHNMQAFKG